MPSSTIFNLMEACRAPGCPVCRLEQQSVERYLDNQFYENVNSPKWRDQLRASLGFCHEHAWLGVEKRLGDALGYSIIYGDIINSILHQLEDSSRPSHPSRRWATLLRQVPEAVRNLIEKMLTAITPRKRCPACDHRDERTRTILSALVDELGNDGMTAALQASDGLCLPHLRLTLEHVKDLSTGKTLLTIQREKLESLRTELGEFIRKSDYQVIKDGFGPEGNAWLRAISMLVGRKNRH